MKKLAPSGILLFLLTCPVMAAVDIDADAENPGCTSEVLHTFTGPTALEADYTANTITLNWYNDNEKITPENSTANSCSYDGGITLPSNEPTKDGYTFAGWQLKIIPFDLSSLNVSKKGNANGYTRLNGNAGSNEATYGLTAGSGEWAVDFEYGIVKGIGICSLVGENTGNPTNDSSTDGAKYCWCEATHFDGNKKGFYLPVESSRWVFSNAYTNLANCTRYCANRCASDTKDTVGFRSVLYGVTQ